METVIAIPVWDHDYQYQFTEDVVEQICGLPGDFTLVVIDNASPNPKTAPFLKWAVSHFTNLRVITNTGNLGYGPAINQAWTWGYGEGAEFFVCLNNDVKLFHPYWLEGAFIRFLREDPKQLLGARMIDFNPSCDFGNGVEPYLEGWALAVARCFLDDVGYFHPEMFLFFEDTELSVRARRNGYATNQSPAFEWDNRYGMPVQGSDIMYHLYGMTGFREGMAWPNPIGDESRAIIVRDHFL